MTSLAELAREHTTLSADDIDHLFRLTAEWAFLADLCFADLLLYAATHDDGGAGSGSSSTRSDRRPTRRCT